MKLAFLTQSYPPMLSGAAIFARQLAEGMAGRGHQVLVIAASDRGSPYLAQSGNLSVLRLRSVTNPLRAGQRFMILSHRAILRALADFDPQLIHTHEPFQVGLTGIAYARHSGIPVSLNIHQLPWFVASYLPRVEILRTGMESLLWGYAGWVLRKFSILFAPTQTISDIVVRRTGICPRTISYGLDLNTFSNLHPSPDREKALRRRTGLPMSVPILLHVGRLDSDKQVDCVIRAAAETMKDTAAHLLMVGDGHAKPALMKLCRSLGIGDRAHFPGYITVGQGLPDLYRLASLFVTASEIETQGIVLLEAAASGLPIVAVRATCIPEIVHHGENGFLAEPGDTLALARAMTTLLQDATLAGYMGAAGSLLAQAHNQQDTLDGYESIYEEWVARNKVKVPGKVRKPMRFFRAV